MEQMALVVFNGKREIVLVEKDEETITTYRRFGDDGYYVESDFERIIGMITDFKTD